MATEKQIAANRANAKRSTGPRTLAGKMMASRNAFRHGLSYGLPPDPASTARLDAMVEALIGEGACALQRPAVTEFARAQLELLKVRAERNRMLALMDLQSLGLKDVTRLQALDRYERYALTKRRRVSHEL